MSVCLCSLPAFSTRMEFLEDGILSILLIFMVSLVPRALPGISETQGTYLLGGLNHIYLQGIWEGDKRAGKPPKLLKMLKSWRPKLF